MMRSQEMETNYSMVVKIGELKQELQRFVEVITEEDGEDIETYERASKTLSTLKDLKFKRSLSQKLGSISVPEHFICPISSELMKDPVILSTGQTYDRPFIQAWLRGGHRTCPRTMQVLSHLILTPNHIIRNMIYQWCEENDIELTLPVHEPLEEANALGGELLLNSLLDKISYSPLNEQKQAAKELRMLTKRMPSFRILIGETSNAIPTLVSMLSRTDLHHHLDIKEDIVTTMLNLSIHDSNKKLVADTPNAIPLLIDALQTGSMEMRRNAAAALFTLSALDGNKVKIVEFGAIKPLIKLLEQGNSVVKKDAASAIFNLCMIQENKAQAVNDGAVLVFLKIITDQSLIDESLAVLAILSSNRLAIRELIRYDGVSCLLNIMRESSCGRNKENAVAILYAICTSDRSKLSEIKEEERIHRTLSHLSRNGTLRARRKATSLLEKIQKIFSYIA